MAFDYQRRSNRFRAEMNLTNLIDVVLNLLIIFMVSAPLMTEGLDVDLPQTRTVKEMPRDSENLVLTIKKDGTLFLDEYQIQVEDVEAQVQKLVTEQKKALFLQADKEVPYGTVVKVMGEIKAAGVDKLGMVAEREPEPNPRKPK